MGYARGGVAVVAVPKYQEAQKKQAQTDARTIHPAAEKYRVDHPGEQCPTVELLRSDGHQVTVLGATAATAAAWASRLPRAEQAAPEAPNREPAWLIVGDRARCRMRVAGLRTVLVGGGPAPNTGRGRCDLEAADLHGAVLAVIGGAAIA